MKSLYKYLPRRYVNSFVEKGEVLFRSLSYFRAYEDDKVRRDRFEGTTLFQPSRGLELTKHGDAISFPGAFESRVREYEIYVFCMSLNLSEDLAKDFKAEACIEIINPALFLGGIRAALARRREFKKASLLFGPIAYYSPEHKPLGTWAIPEQAVMRKTDEYSRQAEYRIAFGSGNAMAVNNVATYLTTTPGEQLGPVLPDRELFLKIGDLRRVTKVHLY